VINHGASLTAVSAVCTHLGCLVHWEESMNLILCPCHGARYKQTGEIITGPQPKPLKQYKATVKNDDLIVSKA
jgi:cytochrome b6-f complex iron-sulfur subunit